MFQKTLLALAVSAACALAAPVVFAQDGSFARDYRNDRAEIFNDNREIHSDRREIRRDIAEIRRDNREIAGDRHELAHDYRALQQDQRQLRAAQQRGDWGRVAQERAEIRGDYAEIHRDRQELRRDIAERNRDVHELRHDRRELRHDLADRWHDRRHFSLEHRASRGHFGHAIDFSPVLPQRSLRHRSTRRRTDSGWQQRCWFDCSGCGHCSFEQRLG